MRSVWTAVFVAHAKDGVAAVMLRADSAESMITDSYRFDERAAHIADCTVAAAKEAPSVRDAARIIHKIALDVLDGSRRAATDAAACASEAVAAADTHVAATRAVVAATYAAILALDCFDATTHYPESPFAATLPLGTADASVYAAIAVYKAIDARASVHDVAIATTDKDRAAAFCSVIARVRDAKGDADRAVAAASEAEDASCAVAVAVNAAIGARTAADKAIGAAERVSAFRTAAALSYDRFRTAAALSDCVIERAAYYGADDNVVNAVSDDAAAAEDSRTEAIAAARALNASALFFESRASEPITIEKINEINTYSIWINFFIEKVSNGRVFDVYEAIRGTASTYAICAVTRSVDPTAADAADDYCAYIYYAPSSERAHIIAEYARHAGAESMLWSVGRSCAPACSPVTTAVLAAHEYATSGVQAAADAAVRAGATIDTIAAADAAVSAAHMFVVARATANASSRVPLIAGAVSAFSRAAFNVASAARAYARAAVADDATASDKARVTATIDITYARAAACDAARACADLLPAAMRANGYKCGAARAMEVFSYKIL